MAAEKDLAAPQHARPQPSAAEIHALPPNKGRGSDFLALVGCNAIVFSASICIMVLELTASRLIASHLGNSLYTWTSVIGVVLAGISAGNYLGGWLADRFNPQKTLGWLFLIAGLSTFCVLFLNSWASAAERPTGMSHQWWVMLVVAWIFLLPALALGTISPVTASMAIKRSAKTGITVGNIYAWGAMGSIVGTFLAGFWLIGRFGTTRIVVITSLTLLVLGAIVSGGQRALRAMQIFGAGQLVLVLGILASVTSEQMAVFCRKVAGVRSGWATTDADFKRDWKAIFDAEKKAGGNRSGETAETTSVTKKPDVPEDKALEQARATHNWRKERKRAEDLWAEWGLRLGSQIHNLGLTLALRDDEPGEYYDESDYFSIGVSDGARNGDPVKKLRLDYLIHSYYDPVHPTKLHYDYERVYAAVTERAAESWTRSSAVAIEQPPSGANLAEALPEGVAWDGTSRKLSVRGAMTTAQLRQLLLRGTDREFREAMLNLVDQSAPQNFDRSNQRQVTFVSLENLPEGVVLPQHAPAKIRYDSALHALEATGAVSVDDTLSLMAQGAEARYVAAVADLWHRSRRVSTMFIGGGGFVFPRWIEANFPDEPIIDVAEIDPAVQKAVELTMGLATEFGSPREGKTYVRTHIGDARNFVDDRLRENAQRKAQGLPAITYDFVYGDAFNDLSVPWHLTTQEFTSKVKELMTPGEGVFLVNIIDIFPRAHATIKKAHTPPAGLFDDEPGFQWESARGEFRQLQLRVEKDATLTYGCRGVMSAKLRDALVALAPADAPFRAAMNELYEKSQAEVVGRFLGRYVNTARDIFPYVYVFSTESGQPDEDRDTFVVACSLGKLGFDGLEDSGDHWRNGPFAWTESEAAGAHRDLGDMAAVLELAREYKLTDDFAPVDNLLAPVFVRRSDD